MKSNAIKTILSVVIMIPGVLISGNINSSVKFENNLSFRSDVIAAKLKDIRKVQSHFPIQYGKYTSFIETYITNLNNQLVVHRIIEPEDKSGFPGLKVDSTYEATTNVNWA